MQNTSIWDAVSKTDPSFTKPNSSDSNTSISSYYIFQKATKQFGPVGIGWGYDILEERYDSGALMGDTDLMSLTHTIKLELWFKHEGETGKITQFGHTPFRYWSKKNKYVVIDQEAPKKSLTDAIKKCLSMLGFGGDVFLGMFDDNQYVTEAYAEAAIGKAENKIEAEVADFTEFREEYKKVIGQIENAVNENMAKQLYGVMKKKIELRLERDPKAKDLLEPLHEATKKSLEQFKGEK